MTPPPNAVSSDGISSSSSVDDGCVLIDTTWGGNGNGGHEYGTRPSDEDKAALIE